jgi:hypothetical protein
MFRKNNAHHQNRLFNDFEHLHPSQKKRLLESWAPVFYEHVFSQIDEAPFEVLYSSDLGRPNFPVNTLLALEFIKHWRDLTDEELLEQASFNYQVMYAIGLRDLGEEYVAPRTLYDFRSRVYEYCLANGKDGDLIFDQFSRITSHFVELTGAKMDEQRTDSTFVIPNIQKAHRLGLAFDVLYHAVDSYPKALLTEAMQEILKPSYRTNILFNTKSSKAGERLHKRLARKPLRFYS